MCMYISYAIKYIELSFLIQLYASQGYLYAGFTLLYGVTLGCMTYCAFTDPGQVKNTRNLGLGYDIEEAMKRDVVPTCEPDGLVE